MIHEQINHFQSKPVIAFLQYWQNTAQATGREAYSQHNLICANTCQVGPTPCVPDQTRHPNASPNRDVLTVSLAL